MPFMDSGSVMGKEEATEPPPYFSVWIYFLHTGIKNVCFRLATCRACPSLIHSSVQFYLGWVAEWSIAHAWKACLPLSVTRVRIPPHPD